MSNWPAMPIGELVQVIGGGTPKKSEARYYGGDIPWVTPKDMKTSVISQAQISITDEGLKQSTSKIAPQNSVLIVVRSGVLKHTVPVAVNKVPVAINQDMKALICSDRIDADYLARFIKARSSEILSWVRATTADNFQIEKLRRMTVPLPALSEQKRIAAVLDQVDALRAKRREAIALLDDLTQSIFLDMFGEPTDGEYPIVQLDDVLERRLKNGISPSSQGNVESQVLTLSAVTRGRFDGNSRKFAKFISDPTVDYSVSRHLFMICRGNGNKDLVGRGVFPSLDMDDTAYPDTMLAAPIQSAVVHPVYLEHVWATPNVRRQIESVARTTNGTYKVNQKTMGAVRFALPGIERQREFAQQVKAIEAAKEAHTNHLTTLDELFTSLQYRAFSGTLWDHEVPGEAA